MDDANSLRATVYPESNPGDRHEPRFEMPTGRSWRFHHWIYSGTVDLDNCHED